MTDVEPGYSSEGLLHSPGGSRLGTRHHARLDVSNTLIIASGDRRISAPGHREFRRNARKLPGLGPKWSCFGEPWNLLRIAAVIADEAAEA